MTSSFIIFIIIVFFFFLFFKSTWNKKKGLYTRKGEIVRSKAEVLIADTLKECGIDYIYEHPLTINGKVVAHPDFYLPKQKIYIEYFGLMHLPDYRKNAQFKLEQAQKHNYKMYPMYPEDITGYGKNKKKFYDKKKIKEYLIKKGIL